MKNFGKTTMIFLALGAVALTTSCNKDKDSSSTARHLYFTYWDDMSVNDVDLRDDPNSYTTLFDDASGFTDPAGITLSSDGYLFMCDNGTNKIFKMKKDGSGTAEVIYDAADGVSYPTAITINKSNGNIYWCNSGSSQVMQGKSDGSVAPVALFGGDAVITDAYGIAIDLTNDKIYTSDFNYSYIQVGNLDGTGTMSSLWNNTDFADLVWPSNIYVEPGKNKIYWSDEYSDMVVVANLDGTGTPEVLFDDTDGVDRADGVYVDRSGGKIYWSETNNNEICRGKLDGTGAKETLITGVESYGIVLGF
jgi:hypothetical protein